MLMGKMRAFMEFWLDAGTMNYKLFLVLPLRTWDTKWE